MVGYAMQTFLWSPKFSHHELTSRKGEAEDSSFKMEPTKLIGSLWDSRKRWQEPHACERKQERVASAQSAVNKAGMRPH